MDRWLVRAARVLGAGAGAFAGLVAVQLMRLRRMQFLSGHPGFWINHVVPPADDPAGSRVLRLAVLGDSTTVGIGVERAEDALPYLIARRVADARALPVHVVSYGWSGARAGDVASAQVTRALEPLRASDSSGFLPSADVIVVVVGANDATHRTRPWQFRQHLRTALERIREAAPPAGVVLAGIPDFHGALRAVEPLIFLTNQYARLLRPVSRAEAARAGVAYADLYREVPWRIRGRLDVLSSDRFHLSPVGYAAWAEVIVEALAGSPEPAASAARVEPAGA